MQVGHAAQRALVGELLLACATAGPGSISSTISFCSACWRAILRAMRDAGDHRLHVVVAAQEVEADLRRRQRIGALQPHRAAAFRAQMHRTDRECRETDAR